MPESLRHTPNDVHFRNMYSRVEGKKAFYHGRECVYCSFERVTLHAMQLPVKRIWQVILLSSSRLLTVTYLTHVFSRRSMACCLPSGAKKEIQGCAVYWRSRCNNTVSDYKVQEWRNRNYRRRETTKTWRLLSGGFMFTNCKIIEWKVRVHVVCVHVYLLLSLAFKRMRDITVHVLYMSV